MKTGIIGETDIEVADGLSPEQIGPAPTRRCAREDKSKIKVEKPKEKP